MCLESELRFMSNWVRMSVTHVGLLHKERQNGPADGVTRGFESVTKRVWGYSFGDMGE